MSKVSVRPLRCCIRLYGKMITINLSPLRNFKRPSSPGYEGVFRFAPLSFVHFIWRPSLRTPTSLFSFTGIHAPLCHWSFLFIFFSPGNCFKNLSHAVFRKSGKNLSSIEFNLGKHGFRLRIFLGAKVQTSQNVRFLLSELIALLVWD